MSRGCNGKPIVFQGHGRREVTASFDGGRLSSDGGALLLREAGHVFGVTGCLRMIPFCSHVRTVPGAPDVATSAPFPADAAGNTAAPPDSTVGPAIFDLVSYPGRVARSRSRGSPTGVGHVTEQAESMRAAGRGEKIGDGGNGNCRSVRHRMDVPLANASKQSIGAGALKREQFGARFACASRRAYQTPAIPSRTWSWRSPPFALQSGKRRCGCCS